MNNKRRKINENRNKKRRSITDDHSRRSSGHVHLPRAKKTVEENIADVTDLTFDLKKLAYLSSAGLRVLMSAQKTMRKQGKMRLINVSDDVIDIMDMVGLTDIFTIE